VILLDTIMDTKWVKCKKIKLLAERGGFEPPVEV
jgi:hypothetical protein